MPGKSHENPSDWRSNWAKAALEKCGWVSHSYYLYLSLSGQLNDLYPYWGGVGGGGAGKNMLGVEQGEAKPRFLGTSQNPLLTNPTVIWV